MFLRIYEISNKLFLQTSDVIETGLLQLTKKDGEIITNKVITSTNFVQITELISSGEYIVKLVTNSQEYKRNIKIEIKR